MSEVMLSVVLHKILPSHNYTTVFTLVIKDYYEVESVPHRRKYLMMTQNVTNNGENIRCQQEEVR